MKELFWEDADQSLNFILDEEELQRLKEILLLKEGKKVNDNINRIEDWENFSNSSNLVLIKDYKGRAFIGVIDGNAMSFQDIVIEILTKLSFNVTQIDDVTNYQIFSVEEG